jgi:hypothetical protein
VNGFYSGRGGVGSGVGGGEELSAAESGLRVEDGGVAEGMGLVRDVGEGGGGGTNLTRTSTALVPFASNWESFVSVD